MSRNKKDRRISDKHGECVCVYKRKAVLNGYENALIEHVWLTPIRAIVSSWVFGVLIIAM